MEPRQRVAQEAARLIYRGAADEYKQAKERAAIDLGTNIIPSNFEVAVELDLLAEMEEGRDREKLLKRMRDAALMVMHALQGYSPILTGSVWRGTARRGSDVDINVYADGHEAITSLLVSKCYKIECSENVVVSVRGRVIRSRHITIRIDDEIEVELIVRPAAEKGMVERCDIYGDPKHGLSLEALEKLMKSDPLRKFVPGRRYK